MGKTRPTKKAAPAKTPAKTKPAAQPRGVEGSAGARPRMIKVRAKQDLYSHENKYFRTGDVLHIPEADFHEDVHEAVDARTPEKVTSSGEALNRDRQETLDARARSRGLSAGVDNPTGASDVLGEQIARDGE
jgi:hypothetical protein